MNDAPSIPAAELDRLLALPAGRELDSEVARRVMGWQDFPYLMSRHGRVGRITAEDLSFCPPGVDVHIGAVREVPQYSASIAAAWQAVEKLNLIVQPHGRGWCATNSQDGDADCREVFAHADKAPLAICRAALVTVARGTNEKQPTAAR